MQYVLFEIELITYLPELKTYCVEINSFILMHYLDPRKHRTQVESFRIV